MNKQTTKPGDAKHRVDPLVMRLRDLAKYKHDDCSIGDEAADRIIELEMMLHTMSWRPIDTAPRDGGWILTFDPEEPDKWAQCAVMRWAAEIDPGWMDQKGEIGHTPSHWMPLPAPPDGFGRYDA